MRSHYKNTDLLKNQPFYSEEIKRNKKKNKEFINIKFLSELQIFPKKSKKLTIKQLSDVLPFLPKRKKRSKRLTKYQILSNVVPFFDDVLISRRERALRGYAENYDVKIMDTKSLDDSLFLAKRSINDFLRYLLEEKRRLKYNLLGAIT